MPPAVPIALFYFFFLGSVGVYWPYLSLYLASLGLGATDVAYALAAGPFMNIVVPPLIGLLADARRVRVWLLRIASLMTAVSFLGFFRDTLSRGALFATVALFAFCRAPLNALADATAVQHVRRNGGSYGRLRLWGSIGFLLFATSGGTLIDRYGVAPTLRASVIGFFLTALCAWWIPAPPAEIRPHALRDWVALLRERNLWLFLGTILCGQAASAGYDACFTLHLQRLGYSSRLTGVAWGIGVFAEVVLLVFSRPLIERFGARKLLTFSLVVAAGRWLVLTRIHDPALLLPLQLLHGITFGVYYPAGVALMRSRATDQTATGAQGLFAAALGLGSVLGLLVVGSLFEHRGGATVFTFAAVVAACGAVLSRGSAAMEPAEAPLPRAIAG